VRSSSFASSSVVVRRHSSSSSSSSSSSFVRARAPRPARPPSSSPPRVCAANSCATTGVPVERAIGDGRRPSSVARRPPSMVVGGRRRRRVVISDQVRVITEHRALEHSRGVRCVYVLSCDSSSYTPPTSIAIGDRSHASIGRSIARVDRSIDEYDDRRRTRTLVRRRTFRPFVRACGRRTTDDGRRRDARARRG